MIIKNANAVTGDFRLHKADLQFSGGTITAIGNLCGDTEYDATGMYLIPGFVDTHIHGAAGSEFAAESGDFDAARKYEAEHGVTAILPTVRCLPREKLIAAEKNILNQMRSGGKGSKLLGINLESPFVNPVRRGGMVPENIASPDMRFAKDILDAAEGNLKIITVAPEMPGALEVIKFLSANGVKVSMGHSDATYDQAQKGAENGATRATHLFNAMAPYHHREPGLIGFSLLDKRVTCEVICDLVHLSEQTIKLIYKMKGADRISIVSDTGVFAGMPDGDYYILGRHRIVKNGECHLEDGTIAGSCMPVYYGVRNLLKAGIPMPDVCKMASYTPAKAVGAADRIGSLEPGKAADMVLLDREYNIRAVFIDGERMA